MQMKLHNSLNNNMFLLACRIYSVLTNRCCDKITGGKYIQILYAPSAAMNLPHQVRLKMTAHTSKDPLHGVTLEMQINALVAHFDWEELGKKININCFKSDPSVKSSLKFLRRTPWARAEVEALYLDMVSQTKAAKADTPAESPWANWHKKS